VHSKPASIRPLWAPTSRNKSGIVGQVNDVAAAALGGVISVGVTVPLTALRMGLLKRVGRYRMLKAAPSLEGEWYSSWQPKSPGQPDWVTEMLSFRERLDHYEFASRQNDCRYQWTGSGMILRSRYLVGEWTESDPNSHVGGAFLLAFHRDDSITGWVSGPNLVGSMQSGRWALSRTAEDLVVLQQIA
jgi:hypothetical protein